MLYKTSSSPSSFFFISTPYSWANYFKAAKALALNPKSSSIISEYYYFS